MAMFWRATLRCGRPVAGGGRGDATQRVPPKRVRPFLGVNDEDEERIFEVFQDHLALAMGG